MKRIVFLLVSCLTLCWAPLASAATNASPTGPGKVNVGQTFNVVIVLNGAKDVDTIRMNGSFTQDLLEYKVAQPTGVFQNVSPGTYVDQSKGIFSFGAFTLSSKANGSARIAVLTFKAKKAGNAYVQLTTNSRVLSAGEDQMGSVGRLNILIEDKVPVEPEQPRPIPPKIEEGKAVISLFSTSHPDPDKWYAENNVFIGWKIEGKPVNKTYIGFDQDPLGPAEQIPTDSLAKFEKVDNGVWYVHLGVEYKDKTFERTDLRIMVDKSLPNPIYPTTDQTDVTADILNYLRYGTMDNVSGIGRYEIFIDGVLATSTLERAYLLENMSPGKHVTYVKAFDMANNYSEGSVEFNILPSLPVVTALPPQTNAMETAKVILFTLFATILIFLLPIWYRRKKEEKRQAESSIKNKTSKRK